VKTRIMILIGLLVILTGVIHVVLFKPLADQWREVTEKTDRSLPKYKTIITDYDPEGVVATTRKMRKDIDEQMLEYNRLRDRYVLDPEVLEARNRIREVLDRITLLQKIETETPGIRIRVTQGWGLGEDFVPGRFGKGLYAQADRYAVMPAEEQVFSREQGTIELWVGPQWNADEDTQKRYFVMAYGMVGEGRTAKQADILLYKDEKGVLTYEIHQASGKNIRLGEPILHWKKGEWHHLAVTWGAKSPDDVALFIDGTRTVGYVPAGTRAGAGAAGLYGGGMAGYDMMMPGMMGMPGAYGIGTRRREETGLAPEVIDEIVIGADRYYLSAAEAIVDELRISKVPRTRFDLNNRPRRDEDTLVLDHMEDRLFDPNLLAFLIQQMESKLKLITDDFVVPRLKREKQVQYDALRKTLALDEEKLSTYTASSQAIQKIYFVDQISQKLEGYNMDRVRNILDLRFPSDEELDSLLSFLDLVHEVLQKAIAQNIDVIEQIEILGEATYLDETELKKFFDKKIDDLAKKAGIFVGDFGMMGMGFAGMGIGGMYPGMMPGMYPGMMPGMMDPGMMGPAGMYPGMAGPGMMGAGQPAGATQPIDPNDPAQVEAWAKQQKEMERARKDYENYKELKERGIIPPRVRREYQEQLADEGYNFYRRRSLRIALQCNVDKLSEFLYHLEFGDRVSSINTMSVVAEGGRSLLSANISFDVHTMEPPPPMEEAEETQVAAGGTSSSDRT